MAVNREPLGSPTATFCWQVLPSPIRPSRQRTGGALEGHWGPSDPHSDNQSLPCASANKRSAKRSESDQIIAAPTPNWIDGPYTIKPFQVAK
jgi:hypothetical protein